MDSIGYKNMIFFLEIIGHNDWFSTLTQVKEFLFLPLSYVEMDFIQIFKY